MLLTSLVPEPSTLQVMQGFVDLWWRGSCSDTLNEANKLEVYIVTKTNPRETAQGPVAGRSDVILWGTEP